MVLLDLRMLVVDVQAGDHPAGDDAGAEPARGGAGALADDPAGEDQGGLVGAADVEVVADDLLEEDPPGSRGVQDLGEGELGLQDRQLVGVAGGDVGGGERVRQDAQPLAQQGLDIGRAEPVADGLQRGGVLAPGEPVVQGLEADPGPGGLPLGPLVPAMTISSLRPVCRAAGYAASRRRGPGWRADRAWLCGIVLWPVRGYRSARKARSSSGAW